MAPQISPKDIPRGEETSDSEEGEPVAPVILETSSSDDEDNMAEDEHDLNQGYVQLAQDDNEGQQTPDQWLSNVSTVVYLSQIKTCQPCKLQLYDTILSLQYMFVDIKEGPLQNTNVISVVAENFQ